MMKVSLKNVSRALGLALALVISAASALAQQPANSTLRGQVTDEFGGVIIGATVTVVDPAGKERTATTGEDGRYTLAGLTPGRYTVRAVSNGFSLYENAEVEIAAGRSDLDITL